ncbi:MAG TPA: ABC transporter permease [Microbacteriaceae bacterium]|jgi:energy-coupling factor transport system substrate-specific component|nr:ABC transporter permease [Microbacteriaceae bacterium]
MSTQETEGSVAATPAAPSKTIFASGRLMAWRGVDLITAAMLAVAFGVAFWGFDTFVYPGVAALAIGFPPAGELSLGVWLVPAVVGGLVVRRPGAALFTELIAANIELILGNGWGVAVLLSGLLQGLGVELVLALFRWRRFGLATAVLGGVFSAVLEIVCYEWWAYAPGYSLTWRLVYLACGVASGALVAGVGGWALVRALARTGALNAFPPGQETRESRRGR